LFETTIKKIKKNYDDKYKINKILKNEIRKKTNWNVELKKKEKVFEIKKKKLVKIEVKAPLGRRVLD
jgi:hypothetical protein